MRKEINFCIQLTRISVFFERTTSQAVSCLPAIVEARFQSRANPLWWIIRQTDKGFFLRTSVFSCQYHSTNAPYSSFKRCSYQMEKRAKTAKHRTEQYFRLFNHYRGKYGRVVCQGHSYHNRSKQDRQCTYNVTLRRVRATIVAVEKQ